MTLADFYLLHAGLRMLAVNLDYMRENILDRGEDRYILELDVEQLADKIGIYIEHLKKERDVYN
jgi:hypothetical protein